MLRSLYKLSQRIMNEYPISFWEFAQALFHLQYMECNQTQIDYWEPVTDRERHCISYYWKFAEIAFGRFRIMPSVTDYWHDLDETLLKHCEIDSKDLVYSFWGYRQFFPGNYVIVHHKTKHVIWGIRATVTPEDIVMDVMAEAAPFLNQYAHQGMISAVGRLMQNVWPLVEKTLQRFADYSLLVTGHSLGAGVTALLTTYLYQHYGEQYTIHGIAYACPPCMNLQLAKESYSCVLAVTVEDDIITRLSFHNFAMLKKRLMLIDRVGLETDLEAHGYMKDKQWLENGSWTDEKRLWMPQRQIFLYKDEHGCVQAKSTDSTEFDSMVVNWHCVYDHSHVCYADYLQ